MSRSLRVVQCVLVLLATGPAAHAQVAELPEGRATVATRFPSDLNGYVIEARMPWAMVQTEPRDGLVIGFDVHVNDADEGGRRERKLVWAGTPGDEQHRSPATFGTVRLGADADDLTGIPRAAVAPEIDGVEDDAWAGAASFPMTHVRLSDEMPGGYDLSGTARALWDDDALYLLVDVLDDVLNVDSPSNRAHWDDGVELYVDGGHEGGNQYDANDIKLTFRPGVDESGIFSLSAGSDYTGRAADAPWRALARTRIETLRKGLLRVRVEDAAGRPVSGAAARVRMTQHAFHFGAAVDAWRLATAGPEHDRYRDFVARHYNAVVLENDFKQRPWDNGVAGRAQIYSPDTAAAAVRWLNGQGISIRGHRVINNPLNRIPEDSVRALYDDPELLRRTVRADINTRIPAIVALGQIDEWDTINHISGWGAEMSGAAGESFWGEIMEMGRRYAPDALHYVNEGDVLTTGVRIEGYEEDIRTLIRMGAAPDGIGFMGHFRYGTFPEPDTVYARLDRFARLIPRLKLTEFDIQTLDEDFQADYLRDILTVAFSHPAMEGVIMWGFWEGDHWRPTAALYRQDWTPKPSGEMWERLVMGEWWTDETVRTGADGVGRVRGFLGDYEVTVEAAGETHTARVELERGGTELVVRLASAGSP